MFTSERESDSVKNLRRYRITSIFCPFLLESKTNACTPFHNYRIHLMSCSAAAVENTSNPHHKFIRNNIAEGRTARTSSCASCFKRFASNVVSFSCLQKQSIDQVYFLRGRVSITARNKLSRTGGITAKKHETTKLWRFHKAWGRAANSLNVVEKTYETAAAVAYTREKAQW